jgi:hypothetical protein
METIQRFRKTARNLLPALLIPVFLFLACRSAPPAPSQPPDFTSCPDLAGSFLFEDLAASCRFEGRKGAFPTYAFVRDGKLRTPSDPEEILPLPLYHWADPGTRLKIEQKGCARMELSLYDPGPAPYNVYEIDLQDLARRGTLAMNRSQLSFQSRGDWEAAQIPIGAARWRENWSFSRDEQGRLVFAQSFRAMGVFWVIPTRSAAEVRCVLPPSGVGNDF